MTTNATSVEDDERGAEAHGVGLLLLRPTRPGTCRYTHGAPSWPWPVVSVPIGGPWNDGARVDDRWPRPRSSSAKRSRPRGAGPPRFSPTRLYFDPWHGHSNHCDVWHHGHAAAEVHALLVQRDVALFHARRASGGRTSRPSWPSGCRPSGTAGCRSWPRRCSTAILSSIAFCDVVDVADVDLAAEPAGPLTARGTRAPRRRTPRRRAPGRDEDAPVEELPAGDAELVLVDRVVLRDAALAGGHRQPAAGLERRTASSARARADSSVALPSAAPSSTGTAGMRPRAVRRVARRVSRLSEPVVARSRAVARRNTTAPRQDDDDAR